MFRVSLVKSLHILHFPFFLWPNGMIVCHNILGLSIDRRASLVTVEAPTSVMLGEEANCLL